MFDHQFLVIIPAPCGVSQELLQAFVDQSLRQSLEHLKKLPHCDPGLAQVDESVIQVVHTKAEAH